MKNDVNSRFVRVRGAADAGGQVVATGPPTTIAEAGDSATGRHLARRLERS
ncbi:hypothetical protein [Actinoplanes sp. NPDC026623]|uniref:hypothetical protein n=1 Tax=Actinoplanes sp. NPDC026623 TaxID=3155610 RepID=UPI00340E4AA8